jgi:hypothetical protein
MSFFKLNSKFCQNPFCKKLKQKNSKVGKSSSKILATSVIFIKFAQSKQWLNRRKFARSGRPGRDRLKRSCPGLRKFLGMEKKQLDAVSSSSSGGGYWSGALSTVQDSPIRESACRQKRHFHYFQGRHLSRETIGFPATPKRRRRPVF